MTHETDSKITLGSALMRLIKLTSVYRKRITLCMGLGVTEAVKALNAGCGCLELITTSAVKTNGLAGDCVKSLLNSLDNSLGYAEKYSLKQVQDLAVFFSKHKDVKCTILLNALQEVGKEWQSANVQIVCLRTWDNLKDYIWQYPKW